VKSLTTLVSASSIFGPLICSENAIPYQETLSQHWSGKRGQPSSVQPIARPVFGPIMWKESVVSYLEGLVPFRCFAVYYFFIFQFLIFLYLLFKHFTQYIRFSLYKKASSNTAPLIIVDSFTNSLLHFCIPFYISSHVRRGDKPRSCNFVMCCVAL
jgi:hypothetical protein